MRRFFYGISMPKKPVLFLLFFAVIIWPLNYVIHYAQPARDAEFSDIIASDEFKMGLYGDPVSGCVSLGAMKSVDMVVVGNSHVYAGVDAYVLSRVFPDKTIAVCGFSLWNLDTFDVFMSYLTELRLAPKDIVWLVDFGSIVDHQNSLKRTKPIHHDYFFNKTTRAEVHNRWKNNIDNGEAVLELSSNQYFSQIDTHKAHLLKRNLATVNEIVYNTEFRDGLKLIKWFERSKVLPDIDRKTRQLCATLSQRNINLTLVSQVIPIQSRELFHKTQFSDDILNTADYLNHRMPCVRQYIKPSLEDTGLDARYFFNRQMKDDFPYEILDNPDDFNKAYEKLSKREQARFYDLTHLNPVGAAQHTEFWAKKLGGR